MRSTGAKRLTSPLKCCGRRPTLVVLVLDFQAGSVWMSLLLTNKLSCPRFLKKRHFQTCEAQDPDGALLRPENEVLGVSVTPGNTSQADAEAAAHAGASFKLLGIASPQTDTVQNRLSGPVKLTYCVPG